MYVFIGGGLGSLCRYGINRLIHNQEFTFPFATLIANVVASFALGVLMALMFREDIGKPMQLLLMVGFCGGLSTFSTFSGENVYLWETGAYLHLLLNVVLSVTLCFVAVLMGMKVGEWGV